MMAVGRVKVWEVQDDVSREVCLDFYCQLVMEVSAFCFELNPGDQANLCKGGDLVSGHIWECGVGGGCCDDSVRHRSSTQCLYTG